MFRSSLQDLVEKIKLVNPGNGRCDICRTVILTSVGSLLFVEALVLVPTYHNHVADLKEELQQTGLQVLEQLQFGAQHIEKDLLDRQLLEPLFNSSDLKGLTLYNHEARTSEVFGEMPERTPLPLYELQPCCDELATELANDTLYVGSTLKTGTGMIDVVIAMDHNAVSQRAADFLWRTLSLVAIICLGVMAAIVFVMGRYARSVEQQAYYDEATGLPNDKHMLELTDHELCSDNPIALMSFQIDDYSSVQDRWGHNNAGQMLMSLVTELSDALPDSTTLGRHSLATFSIIVRDNPNHQSLQQLVQTIQSILADKLSIGADPISLTACIAVLESTHCTSSSAAAEVLEMVEMSLRDARKSGANNVVFYHEELRRLRDERIFILTRLRTALKRDQLALHYQLQYHTQTGQPAGFEALMRWNHPKLGAISPGVFIPLAEESGVIVEYGSWALQQAAAEFAALRDRGLYLPRASVNLSPRQFMDPNLLNTVGDTIERYQLKPGELELEITESAIFINPAIAQKRMAAIKELGVLFAIDDFGTGHSTLSNLGAFPFSRLKIDQSFVRNIQHSKSNQVIVKSCIDLAHGLGMDVVAEGVEETAEYDVLADWHCDVIQGYLFSKPETASRVATDLARLQQAQFRKSA